MKLKMLSRNLISEVDDHAATQIDRAKTSKKISQNELADKADISKGFISQIRNKVRTPSVDTIKKLDKAGVKLDATKLS